MLLAGQRDKQCAALLHDPVQHSALKKKNLPLLSPSVFEISWKNGDCLGSGFP